MKKVISIVVLVLCIITGSTLAETTKYEGEILFRNIPWGGTIDEVETALAGENLDFSYETEGSMGMNYTSLSDIVYMNGSWSEEYATEMSSICFTPITVAGYETFEVELYFAYLPNEDNEIDKKRENTFFTLACYKFKPVDLDRATEDMKGKLSSLYGDIDKSETKRSAFKSEFSFWFTDNDSFICLHKVDYSASPQMLIYYGTFKGEELIQKAKELQVEAAKEAEIKNSESGGTDGL